MPDKKKKGLKKRNLEHHSDEYEGLPSVDADQVDVLATEQDGLLLSPLSNREHNIMDLHLDPVGKEAMMAQLALDDEQVKYAEEQGQLVKFHLHLLTAVKTYAIWIPAWESFKFLKRRLFKASLFDGAYSGNLHMFLIKMREEAPGVNLRENDTISERVNDGLSDACMFHYGFVPGPQTYELKMALMAVTQNKHMQMSMIEEAKQRRAVTCIADTSLAEDPMLRDYQLLARNDPSMQAHLQANVLHPIPPSTKKQRTVSRREADNDSQGAPLSPEKRFKNNVKRYGEKWSPERVKAFVVGLTSLICMDWLEKSLHKGPDHNDINSLGSYCTFLLGCERKEFPHLGSENTAMYHHITACMEQFPAYKDGDKALFRKSASSKKMKEKWEFDGQDLKDKWKNIVRYYDKESCLPLRTLENCRTLTLDDYDREMVTNVMMIMKKKWGDHKTYDDFRNSLQEKFDQIMDQLGPNIEEELKRQKPVVAEREPEEQPEVEDSSQLPQHPQHPHHQHVHVQQHYHHEPEHDHHHHHHHHIQMGHPHHVAHPYHPHHHAFDPSHPSLQ
jgi:hypothetical protein